MRLTVIFKKQGRVVDARIVDVPHAASRLLQYLRRMLGQRTHHHRVGLVVIFGLDVLQLQVA
jgi:hypothetical protein